jgi:hypothetical protein
MGIRLESVSYFLNVLADVARDEVAMGIDRDQSTADRIPWHGGPPPDEPTPLPGQSRGLMSKHVAVQKRLIDVVPHDFTPDGFC